MTRISPATKRGSGAREQIHFFWSNRLPLCVVSPHPLPLFRVASGGGFRCGATRWWRSYPCPRGASARAPTARPSTPEGPWARTPCRTSSVSAAAAGGGGGLTTHVKRGLAPPFSLQRSHPRPKAWSCNDLIAIDSLRACRSLHVCIGRFAASSARVEEAVAEGVSEVWMSSEDTVRGTRQDVLPQLHDPPGRCANDSDIPARTRVVSHDRQPRTLLFFLLLFFVFFLNTGGVWPRHWHHLHGPDRGLDGGRRAAGGDRRDDPPWHDQPPVSDDRPHRSFCLLLFAHTPSCSRPPPSASS
jgi:hypothetical protein